jgi:DNA-binding response OmpR family regulator
VLPEVDQLATVVVCEDEQATLELLCDHLTADRYTALPAPCASDALRLCHFKQPDLLLLDLRLPDASGLDVLREIRSTDASTGSYDPDLPVVVLSGRGTDADRVRGFTEGADDYVVKPFHYPELEARLRAVLRRRAPGARGRGGSGSCSSTPRPERYGSGSVASSSPTRSSRCSGRSPRSPIACSPSTSCFATYGAFAP